MRIRFSWLVLGCFFSGFVADAKPPNIVFILADDLGWMDTAVYGSTFYQTPHIDRLAAEGARFTDAYATPLCSPSRGAALTGRQPERFQLYTAITRVSQDEPEMAAEGAPFQNVIPLGSRSHLPLPEKTMAEVLSAAGYKSHFIGKWHLGPGGKVSRQGFDNVVCAGGAAAGYFAPYKWLSLPAPKGEYLPERLTREAVDIIRDGADSDNPFFLALWHFNVHVPLQARETVIEKYEGRVDPANPQRNPTMAAMIEALDNSVGEIVEALKDEGIYDDTLLVFVSDNGGVSFGKFDGRPDDEPVPTSNLPLRGWKGTIYEGGIRVPMIVHWPGVTHPGTTIPRPVHLVDLLPTFADAAKLRPEIELDGVSLKRLLEGEGWEREHPLIWYFPQAFIPNGYRTSSAIRVGNYKLIRFYCEADDGGDVHELYDLSRDLSEKTDLAARMPGRVAQLSAALDEELKRIGAREITANPTYDPAAPMPKRIAENLLHP